MSSSEFRSFSGLIAENHAFVPIVQFAVVGQLWGFALGLFAEGERLKIRSDYRGDAATLGLGGDFARRGFMLAERFLKALDGNRQANLVAVSEAVGHGLNDAEHFHGHAFYDVDFDSFREQRVCEAHDANRGAVRLRGPVFLSDRQPYFFGKLISQAVEGECGDEADHPLRDTFCDRREAMVGIEWGVRELVKTTGESKDLAIPLHAADRRGRHAGSAQFGEPGDPVRRQEGVGGLPLRGGFGH